MTNQIKTTLGKYVLIETLGTTALATVYLARDSELEREVVLKVLRPYFSQEPALLNSFKEYMKGVQQLQHSNIVPIHSIEEGDGVTWLVKDYVKWPSLKRRPAGATDPTKSLSLLRQIAKVVDYAHNRGVHHRNIKPSNIFVNEDGSALLDDFGMIVLAEGTHDLVRSNLNTPLATYAAPEQSRGLPEDRRTDIYSMGVLFYELSTGMVPFHALSPHSILAKQLYSLPTPPSLLNPSLPHELDSVILKALNRQPEERYSSGLEFVEALERVLDNHPEIVKKAVWDLPQTIKEPSPGTEVPLVLKEAVVEETAIALCPVCGHGNPAGRRHCTVCWARLGQLSPITRQEVESLKQQRKSQERRSRLLRGAVVLVVVLAFGAWIAAENIGTTQFLPPPASAVSSSPSTNEWSMLHRDPTHNGFVNDDSPVPEGKVKWTFKTNAPLSSSPAIVGNTVYLSTGDRRIVALDLESGDLIWEYPVTGPVHSSPAVAGELVYVGLRDYRLLALNKDTGNLVWQFITDNPILSSPTVSNGVLYIGSGDGRLYALDALTGKVRWSYLAGSWIISSPAVYGDVVALPSFDGHLSIIDIKNGKKRLAFDTRYGLQGSPVFEGDRLYIADGKGRVHAIDWRAKELPFERGLNSFRRQLYIWGIVGSAPQQKGTVWFFTEKGGIFFTTLVVAWDKVYAASSTGKLYALDKKSGEKLWEFRGENALPQNASLSSPSVMQRTLFVGDKGGNVYALDAITGEKRWQFTAGGAISATPVAAEGLLFVTSEDGTLYVFR